METSRRHCGLMSYMGSIKVIESTVPVPKANRCELSSFIFKQPLVAWNLHTTTVDWHKRSSFLLWWSSEIRPFYSSLPCRVRVLKMRCFFWWFIPPSPGRWWRWENSMDYTGMLFQEWIQRVCFHQGAQQINCNNAFPLMKETSVAGELTSDASSPSVWSCLGFFLTACYCYCF